MKKKGAKDLISFRPRCMRNRFKNIQQFKVIEEWDRIDPVDGYIHWHLDKITTDVEGYRVIRSFDNAMQMINEALAKGNFNFRMKSTSNPDKAQITCCFKVNGDAGLPIPFDEYTLAYAMNDGNTYMNDNWDWTDLHHPEKILMKLVVVHEFLHELLVGHTTFVPDIMQATYNEVTAHLITPDTLEALTIIYPEYIQGTTPPVTNIYKEGWRVLSQSELLRLRKTSLQKVALGLGLDLPDRITKRGITSRIINKIKS